MANNGIVNSLTFVGAVVGQAVVQAQSIGGNLTFQLPNQLPAANQLLTASLVSGNVISLGWSNPQSAVLIALSQITQSGATTGQTIEWNGSAWVPVSTIPGAGTVTSFSAGTLAPIFTTSVANGTSTPALSFILTNAAQNAVLAGPSVGGAGAPSYRVLVAADIPPLPYDASGAAAAAQANALAADPTTIASAPHFFLNSYTSGSHTFTAAQPDFTDLTGAATIAQINSKRGNGTFVQISDSNAATGNGDVVTYDANGNTHDSSVPLSSLAPLASPSFTGTASVVNAHITGTLADGTNSVGTSGQLLSSTASATAWISQSALSVAFTQVTGTATEGQLPAATVFTDKGNTFPAGHQQVFNVGSSNIAFVDPADNTKSMYIDVSTVGTGTSVALAIPASTSWSVVTHNPVAHEFVTGITSGVVAAAQPATTDLSDASSIPQLYTQAGAAPAAGDNHIASGTATLVAGTVTVTLTGFAIFADTNYVVQLTYQGTPTGTPGTYLYATLSTGSSFSITSSNVADTSIVAWTAIGF